VRTPELARRLVADRDLRQELRLAAKMTLAGTLSWWTASALGAHRPIFATLVPLVVMTGDPFSAVSVSVDRMLGVFAGVGIGIALVHLTLPGTITVGIALAAGTAVGILLRVGQRVNVQAAVSALFMIGVAGSSHVGVTRVWETAIGAVISIVVATAVWPPDPLRELRHRLDRLRNELVDDLTAIALDLATGGDEHAVALEEIRTRSLEAVKDVFELEPARRAMRWNPRRRHDVAGVDVLEARINLAARLYRHTRSIARDVVDLPVRSPLLASAARDLADAADRKLTGSDAGEQLERAAAALVAPHDGAAAIVAVQLRQFLADLV